MASLRFNKTGSFLPRSKDSFCSAKETTDDNTYEYDSLCTASCCAITAIIDCTDGSVAYNDISNAVLVCGASNVDNRPIIFKYASCSSFVNVGNCFTSLAIFTSSACQ